MYEYDCSYCNHIMAVEDAGSSKELSEDDRNGRRDCSKVYGGCPYVVAYRSLSIWRSDSALTYIGSRIWLQTKKQTKKCIIRINKQIKLAKKPTKNQSLFASVDEFERKSFMSIKEKAELIVADIKKEQGTNPVLIFENIAKKEYVSINGPEHHILDGASLLMAYKNAGGEIDIDQALDRLMAEGLRMPGAMCGLWGICGAITSIGAALAIIDGTGPLSTDGSWGSHMQFTSKAIGELGIINGPRCCKRDAMIAFKNGVDYVNAHYDVTLQYEQMKCEFTGLNEQCIKDRCPFYAHSFQQEY